MYVTANWRKSSILSVSVKSDLNVNSLRSRLTYLPCGHAWAPVPTVSFLDAQWQYSHADFTLVSFKASCLLHKWAEEACVWAQSVYFLFFFFSSPDLFPADRWPKPPCTSAPQWMCVCVCVSDPGATSGYHFMTLCERLLPDHSTCSAKPSWACPTLIIVSVNSPRSNKKDQTNRFNVGSRWQGQIVR